MKKVNLKEVEAQTWASPKGKFASVSQEVSVALGREATSTDLTKRHPFDVELSQVPPGKSACPYHSHSAQWEFYHVVSGQGAVRHESGTTPVGPGDCFLFPPGEAHQIINDHPSETLVFFIVADNPFGESCHYPDSGKWMVRSPKRRLIRSENLDYCDGEE